MAREVLTNVQITLGGTDVSNYFKSVSLEEEVEQIDITCFGDTKRTYAAGFSKWTGSLNGILDLATIEPLLNSIRTSSVPYGATLTVLPKKGTAVGVANPSFTGTVKFTNIPIFVSEAAAAPGLNLSFNGSGTITRSTT